MEHPASNNFLQSMVAGLRQSLAVRLLLIGIILLLLLIPAFLVSNLISERQSYQRSVVHEISAKWGGNQWLSGPMLLLPAQREQTVTRDQKVVKEQLNANFLLLPETLKITASVQPEIRYRGIYQAVLYTASITMEGSFLPQTEGDWKLLPEQVKLLFPLSDLTGLRRAEISLNGVDYPALPGIPVQPGARELNTGFHVRPGALNINDPLVFKIRIELNGSEQLRFAPLGRTTELKLDSSWNAPSFQGAFLPLRRDIRPDGFEAEYQITELNRNFPQLMQSNSSWSPGDSSFGVDLTIPVNVYQQVSRTAKYAVLFIIAALLALLFTERLTQKAMHPAQYLVSGLGIVMFYAILLSVAEHTGFGVAFALSALLTAGTLTFYCRMIFRSMKTALLLGGLLLIGYGVLYLLLQLQDFALLTGVTVLFVLLLALMLVTGRMNRPETP